MLFVVLSLPYILFIHNYSGREGTNDFVAVRGHAGGISVSDIEVSSTKSTAMTNTNDTTGLWANAATARTMDASQYYVAGLVSGDTDNVTYAAISSGAIGTAIYPFTQSNQWHAGHGTLNFMPNGLGKLNCQLILFDLDIFLTYPYKLFFRWEKNHRSLFALSL